ncbi:MAG TPA: PspA/IM30 family protein [Bryobacteraceae bacterium]|nr:PspA/IM30 family protein [Bryobacteraceae bacterium]
MALLERVATLIRANLNELIDKAEHPEIMLKQVITDMENQFMQVKTQVAVAIADQHLLEKRQKEHEEKTREWMHKAELAVDKHQDDLARVALENADRCRKLGDNFHQQVADQRTQVENLKTALHKLEQKLMEARSKRDLLIAQHRRSRALGKAADAGVAMGDASNEVTFDRMRDKVQQAEAVTQAKTELAGEDLDEKFAKLERDDRIEEMLAELKNRRGQAN